MRTLVAILGFAALAGAAPAVAQHSEGPSVNLQLVAEGLVAPVQLTAPLDGSGRRFVVDQVGVVRIITREGRLLGEPFLDLRKEIVELQEQYDERGLLGLAFHPRYRENGRFYAWYSVPARPGMPDSTDHANRLVEFHVSASDPNRADPQSSRLLMELAWPYSNHNGGTLAFGPDGFLYVALGDGGNRDDEGRGHVSDWYEDNAGGNAQNIEANLYGKILRIDVNPTSAGRPYGIPADNPFVGRTGMAEIWAYGLRNPFRIAFDAETGTLFAADAGQELYEEVNIIVKGGNYGWNVMEGLQCFDAEDPQRPPYHCPRVAPNGDTLRLPIAQYDHYKGVVAVGGVSYRGKAADAFHGRYLFADWSYNHDQPRGTLFIAAPPPLGRAAMWDWQELAVELQGGGEFHEYIRSFGEDADREAYVLTANVQGPTGTTGKVWKVTGGSMGQGGHQH